MRISGVMVVPFVYFHASTSVARKVFNVCLDTDDTVTTVVKQLIYLNNNDKVWAKCKPFYVAASMFGRPKMRFFLVFYR